MRMIDSLIGVSTRQLLLNLPHQRIVAEEMPLGNSEKSWRYLCGETLYNNVRRELFQIVAHEVNIVVDGEMMEAFGGFRILLFHDRILENLKLVELDKIWM